ncbi:NmrA family NAD(P)-binding protein [Phormidium tenue FACHB-886]|nr:NmrA family NAD(P)-binding protein [Phormidium tenue FACHB-886]
MSNLETAVGKVLLIGATGGTGSNAVKGLLEQNVAHLRAITRKIDLTRPSLSRLHTNGVELVEADLDDESSLKAAFARVSAVYCHATAPQSLPSERSMNCPDCCSAHTTRLQRRTNLGYALFRCRDCHRTLNERTGTPFNFIEVPNICFQI